MLDVIGSVVVPVWSGLSSDHAVSLSLTFGHVREGPLEADLVALHEELGGNKHKIFTFTFRGFC